MSALEVGLRLLAPWALAVIVDQVIGVSPLSRWLSSAFDSIGVHDRRSELAVLVGAGLGLQLAHALVVMLHGRVSVAVGQRLIRSLREQQFAHLQALSLRHHAAMPSGDMVQLLHEDARCIEQIVIRGLFPLAFSALTLLVMFVCLVRIDLPLALLALSIVPPLYLWLRHYARRMSPQADDARRADSQLSSRLFQSISAIRLTKSHAREDYERERFSEVAGSVERAWIRVGRQGAVFAIVNGALTLIGSSLILYAGGLAVLDGRLSVGTLLLVLAYVGYVYGPLSAIANTTSDLQRAFASVRRIRDTFSLTPEPSDPPDAIACDRVRGDVRFSDVSFGYGDRRALDGVSLAASPGEIVALVGPSGAGKSTLASLLLRFYDRDAGSITIDGAPIERLRVRDLREQIAIVLQEPILFSGTIRENLRYGRLSASDADVERAARAANAHEFICELPDGYETMLGENGARLSGGQRQRLCIARALLKDAPILVLDEPTSALDTLSEQQVVDAIRTLCAGRTTFVIAHRLSTVRDATRIVVMEHGRVVGEGTHDELRRTNLLYRKLTAQLSEPAPDEQDLPRSG